MTQTTEQYRALIDAIAAASTIEALVALRGVVRHEYGLDAEGGFVESLIQLRQHRLERLRRHPSRIA